MPEADLDAYLDTVPSRYRAAVEQLVRLVRDHLPDGFAESWVSGAPAWGVPLDRYPDGDHCAPEQPLPFLSIAVSARQVTLHHMGLYAMPELKAWFQSAYAEAVPTKRNMGAGCVRFPNPARIPWDLLATLMGRVSVDAWITAYEAGVRR